MDRKRIDVFDLIIMILKHKKFIFFVTLTVSIAAVVYSIVATKYWTSCATILPANRQESPLSMGSSLLGFGSSLLGINLQQQSTELITIMKSRTFSEDVVREFELLEYMEIQDPDTLVAMEAAVNDLKENICRLSLNEETGLIGIIVETKDRYLSRDIANFYWQLLDRYNSEMRMTKGKQKRIFIEKRLREVEKDIGFLSKEIYNFQANHNVVELETQTLAIIEQYSSLLTELIEIELEIEYNRTFMHDDSYIVQMLSKRKASLQKKISDIEISKVGDKPKYLINIDDLPNIAMDYANLTMNLEIQRQVYEMLYPQLESAKIEEVRDLPTIELIDEAVPAGLRSRPKRSNLCITLFLAGLFFSVVCSLGSEFFKQYIEEDDNRKKFDNLKSALKLRS